MLTRISISLCFVSQIALATTYYVSPSGNDSNNGTSQSTPWKTVARVNTQELDPGDIVQFQGGATFNSSVPLTFTDPKDQGSASNPVHITSYGTGRATIQMTNDTEAVVGQQISGYKITNLIFRGPGWTSGTKNGIHFYAWAPGNLESLLFDNVDVTNFKLAGISIQASIPGATYTNVKVVNSNLSGNHFAGFETIGPGAGGNHTARTLFDITVSNVQVLNNGGIAFGSVQGGRIERSRSGNNGYTGDVATGIFIYDSTDVTIQDNELFGNENYGTGTDGNGITLDYGSNKCIVQRNFTHDNIGAGILLLGNNQPGLPHSYDNIVRYNISVNDGLKYTFGGISIYRGVTNSQIYNNTVVSVKRDAFQIWDWMGTGVTIRNNIFVTAGGTSNFILNIFEPNDGSDLDTKNVVIQGNDYWGSGGKINLRYDTAGFYSSLSAFRTGTGHEMVNGYPSGLSLPPNFLNPNGGSDKAENYKLGVRSRLRSWGLDLKALFGTDPGPSDFFGNPLPSGPAWAIGAHDPQ